MQKLIIVCVESKDIHDTTPHENKLKKLMEISEKIADIIKGRDYVTLSPQSLTRAEISLISKEIGRECFPYSVLDEKHVIQMNETMSEILGIIKVFLDHDILLLISYYDISKWLPVFFKHHILGIGRTSPIEIDFAEASITNCISGETTTIS